MENNERLRPGMLREFRLGKAVRLVWQSAPGWTTASIVLILVQGTLPLVTLYLMKLVVDAVTSGITSPDKGEAFRQVAFLIALAGGVTLFNALFSSIAGIVREQQTLVVSDYMNNIIHAKSIEMDLEYYENSKYYDTLHRAQHEGPYRPSRIVNGLVQMGQNSISLVAVAGLLLTFHWSVTALLFITVIPGAKLHIFTGC
jgi:ATP-binding cassette subfamily B protein